MNGISFVLHIQLAQTNGIQVQHLIQRFQHLCHSEYLQPETTSRMTEQWLKPIAVANANACSDWIEQTSKSNSMSLLSLHS